MLGGDDEYQNRDDSFWEDLIHDADLNEDGQIDYNEFLIMMKTMKWSDFGNLVFYFYVLLFQKILKIIKILLIIYYISIGL